MKQATIFSGILLLLISCSNSKNDTEMSKNNKDTNSTSPISKPETKAITINIQDTICPAQLFICIKDSAATMEGIGNKLGLIYGVKLAEVLKKNKMVATGAPVAWYKTNKAPYFFEAGLPVSKTPAKMAANVFIKEIKSDSALIAHCAGPYDQLVQAYDAVKEQAKVGGKKITLTPFEVYIDDPLEKDGTLKDPYKVKTDVVFTRH